MDFLLYYILPFAVVLGVLIFFHELGHFITAKSFGIKVLKFSLGFGPRLLWKKVGETEYSIRIIPLGGFVKMLGEDVQEENAPDLTPEDAERAFNKQHVLKRMAVVGAGPIFNLALALFMFCGLYFFSGMQVIPAEIGQVTEGSPAEKAGLMKGDAVISIQGVGVEKWSDIKALVHDRAGEPLAVTLRRQGQLIEATVVPEAATVKNEFGEDVESALIGIVSSGKVTTVELGPWEALKEGIRDTWKWIKLTCLVIAKLFQGVVSLKTVGGPILIGQMTGQLAQESFSYLIPFMAIISVNLGILNLLPIPILDGGLIIFLLMELVLGKPLSIRTREYALKIGLFLLVLLMVVVTYNDLTRIKIFEKLLGKLFG
jgi:regulator of sigma E protease